MYVKIGPYKDYRSTYCVTKYLEKILGEDLVDKIDYVLQPIVNFCWNDRFWNDRKIKIHIDNYDVWSMDHTLALIIVPMLKKLKEQKHGSPVVDAEDLPPEIAHIEGEDAIHEKWSYIIDQMIWAFEQDILPEGWESQYYSGEIDRKFVEKELDGKKVYVSEYGEKHTFKINMDGMKAHEERMKKGRYLFAKYYNSLWD